MKDSSQVTVIKNLPANAGDARDMNSFPWSGRIPGEGKSNPFQDSGLENSIDRRRLVGYSPWEHKESDTAEQMNTQTYKL